VAQRPFARHAFPVHVGAVERTQVSKHELRSSLLDGAVLLGHDLVEELDGIARVAAEGVVGSQLRDLLRLRGGEQQTRHSTLARLAAPRGGDKPGGPRPSLGAIGVARTHLGLHDAGHSGKRPEVSASKLLAIDQGTTGTTALVMGLDGVTLGRATEEVPQHYPAPGWVEHDVEEIWETVVAATRAVLRVANVRPADIAAVGVANQRETVVAWDRETGCPIGRAIVWQDRRTADSVSKA
jgi:hypothetical protein